jgi:hypothetical protein
MMITLADLQTARTNGDSCMYLSVLNDVENELPGPSTNLRTDYVAPPPSALYHRHWKIPSNSSEPGATLDEIIAFMTSHGQTKMYYVVRSLEPPWMIMGTAAELKVWLQPDPYEGQIGNDSFNEWGEEDF